MGTLAFIKTSAVFNLLLLVVHLSLITFHQLHNYDDMNKYPLIYTFVVFQHFADYFIDGINSFRGRTVITFLADIDFFPQSYFNPLIKWSMQFEVINAWTDYQTAIRRNTLPVVNTNAVYTVPLCLRPLFNGVQITADGQLTYQTMMAELKYYIDGYNITNRNRKRDFYEYQVCKVRALKVKTLLSLTIFNDFYRRIAKIEQRTTSPLQLGRKRPHEDQDDPNVSLQRPRSGKKKPKHRSVGQDQESKSAGHLLVAASAISATLLLVALVGLGLYAWLRRPDGNGNSQANAESSDGSSA